jgi:hypothetical protein
VLSARDDARPRACATRRFNVACVCAEGQLARPQDRAFHALVARLEAAEAALSGAPVFRVPRVAGDARPSVTRAPRVAAATAALLDRLAELAEIPRSQPIWRALRDAIVARGVARRQARAAELGALAYDLSLTARRGSWRAGITLNDRARPDLPALAARLVGELGADRGAADAALAAARRPRLELTLGAVVAGGDAKLKLYAQERRNGDTPLDRAALARLAEICARGAHDGRPRRLPSRAGVACVDLHAGRSALKIYVASPPAWLAPAERRRARAFAAAARRGGGYPYFTIRLDGDRAGAAMNAVYRLNRREAREGAWSLARAELGGGGDRGQGSRGLDELMRTAAEHGAQLAVTAIGIDLDGGDEADVYVVPW